MIDYMTATPSPPPVNLIIGAEEFLAERRRKAIVEQARAAAGRDDLPVDSVKTSEIDKGELAELLSPSLFAEDRIVAINGIETAAKETIELIEQSIKDPAPGVVLILWHKGNGRNKKLTTSWPKLGAYPHEAGELRRPEKLNFIEQEFRSHRVRVTADVCRLLFEVIGSDLRELASAVSQLVADTDGAVNEAAVRTYYQGKAEVSGFEMATLAVEGNSRAAVALARRALQLGESPVMLAAALSATVGDIAKVAGAGRIDPRRDAATFGMPPWKLEKTVRTARRWDGRMVARATQIVADLDAGVKGQSADPAYALENAVAQICALSGR